MLSKSITYIQGEPFKENKYQTYQENNDEQEFTFDQIQQYYIPYDQITIDWEKCYGHGAFAIVYPGYIIQKVIDE